MYLSEKLSFCTGSKFEGYWDINRTGTGVYTYPNGTEYRGKFENGMFHGEGILIFPSKFHVYGTFEKGKCVSFRLFFADGLEYKPKNWGYCTYPDRRYYPEILNGINPVGDSYLTKDFHSRSIPKNSYDLEEGFGEPDTGLVTEDAKKEKPLRYLGIEEKAWMIKNCRVSNLEKVGYNKEIADANLQCERQVLGCWGEYCFDISWDTIADSIKSYSDDNSENIVFESSSSSLESYHTNSVAEKSFIYDSDFH